MTAHFDFQSFLKTKDLKLTEQRKEILKTFMNLSGHISAEDLYQKISKINPKIGYSTVYRTLKLLTQSGLAEEKIFTDKISRYESKHKKPHHDHLICQKCGKIEEFENPEVEKAQERIASKHNFKIKDHKFEIYGICAKCE